MIERNGVPLLLEIIWRDAWYEAMDSYDAEKTEHVMRTVGYVVQYDEVHISGNVRLASELDPDDNPRGVTSIPLVLVVSTRELQ